MEQTSMDEEKYIPGVIARALERGSIPRDEWHYWAGANALGAESFSVLGEIFARASEDEIRQAHRNVKAKISAVLSTDSGALRRILQEELTIAGL